MNSLRIEQLEQFKKEDPNDPFPKYALALEYLQSDPEKSKSYFDDLLMNHSDYIGTYYHAAALYSKLGNREKAEEIYQKGISIARTSNEAHALKELQNAYTNFQFDE